MNKGKAWFELCLFVNGTLIDWTASANACAESGYRDEFVEGVCQGMRIVAEKMQVLEGRKKK